MRPADRLGFMRDHRFVRSHISQYIDGELDGINAARVERHTRWCPHCAQLLSSLRLTVNALAGLRQRPRQDMAETIIARLRANELR